jgi:hypothetical protein
MPADDIDPNSLTESKSRAERLAEWLLEDRAKHAERQQERQAERSPAERDPIGFDPYQTTKWQNVAGPASGYMPTTPMRRGSAGFYIRCKACNAGFESKGWAYCPTCMELPAEERHAMKPAFVGRMCQAPGCEKTLPRTARADAKYCSKACRQRASYSTDKPAHRD